MPPFTFDDFLRTAPGKALLAWESSQFDELSQDAFGYQALQVGCPAMDTLRANRISAQWLTDERTDLSACGSRTIESPTLVLAESGWLPFDTASLDLVTLPHTLDFAASPHQTLREAARVLRPEGRLILTAFNPLSFWWLRQKSVALGLAPYLPTHTVPISLYRLKDWLALLGFEIICGRFGLYMPWCRSEKGFQHWDWINKAGDRWAPHCANLIVLSAVKRLPGMKFIGKVPVRAVSNLVGRGAPVTVPREAHRTGS